MPHFSSASLTLNNVQEEIPFVLEKGICLRISGSHINKEQIEEEMRIWGGLRKSGGKRAAMGAVAHCFFLIFADGKKSCSP